MLVPWLFSVRLAALYAVVDTTICLSRQKQAALLVRQVSTSLWTYLSLEVSRVTGQGLQ